MIADETTQREEVAHMVMTLSAAACASARLRTAAQPMAALAHGTRRPVADAFGGDDTALAAAQAAVPAPPPGGAPPV